jgi:hypothetical protein
MTNNRVVTISTSLLLFFVKNNYAINTEDGKQIVIGKEIANPLTTTIKHGLYRIDVDNAHTSITSSGDGTLVSIRGSKPNNVKNRKLQTCNECSFSLYTGTCSDGYVVDSTMYSNYKIKNGNGTCYENTCCSESEIGFDCCIKPGISGTNCATCTSTIWDIYSCPDGRNTGLYDTYRVDTDSLCYSDTCCAENINDCCSGTLSDDNNESDSRICDVCPTNSTVWDVQTSCPYGKNTALFGKYPLSTSSSKCADETCCSPNKDDCCLPASTPTTGNITAPSSGLMHTVSNHGFSFIGIISIIVYF